MSKVTHGAAKRHIKLYRVFRGMMNRCYREKTDMYSSYGALGVKVHQPWIDDPMTFVDWALSNGYQEDLQIDREDVFGDYTPSNCRFVTALVNARNKRNSRMITYKGETRCLGEWAEITGIPDANLQVRLDRCGWGVERAFTEQPKKRKQKLEWGGKSMTAYEWAELSGVSHSAILSRHKKGQDLSAPPTPPSLRRYPA